jgi:DDE domain
MDSMLSATRDMTQRKASFGRRARTRSRRQLSWKPHPKSMSVCQLSLHIAGLLGNSSKLAQLDEFEVSLANFDPAIPNDAEGTFRRSRCESQNCEQYVGRICGHHIAPNSHAPPLVSPTSAYPAAVEALKADGVIPRRVVLRQCKYLNNVIEQDHRTIKKRVWLAKGCRR